VGESVQSDGPRLGSVFVSSVFGGMKTLRERVERAARTLGLEPVMSEQLVAQSADVATVLRRTLTSCDTYVGLFSHRRGTVPGGERAITEQEFFLARELGLRTLVFIDGEPDGIRDPGLDAFLRVHVHPYRGGVYPNVYADEQELGVQLSAALSSLLPSLTLWIGPADPANPEGMLHARLFTHAVQPAFRGVAEIGPFEFTPGLSSSSEAVLTALLSGAESRSRLKDEAVILLGADMGSCLPPAIVEAIDDVLKLATARGLQVTLRVRSSQSRVQAMPWEVLSIAGHRLPVRSGILEIVRDIPLEHAAPDPREGRPPELGPVAREFGVLGFTADPLEDEIIQFGVGASTDAHHHKLFWEKEQERLLLALEPQLRAGRGRLVLPDVGSQSALQEVLARDDRPTIVHFSCHGGTHRSNGHAEQVLFLEDEDGRREPTSASELLTWLKPRDSKPAPDLVVLSACYTASGLGGGAAACHRHSVTLPGAGDRAGSMAAALLNGGLPRVLGMQSSVSDAGATEFAASFYRAIAEGADLVRALAAGRSALGKKGQPHEWAVPVLLTRGSTGPLCAMPDDRDSTSAAPGGAKRAYLIDGVSYLGSNYVGRRHFERRLHRAWAGGARFIVIHGLGGIGKSTLAARFLERRELNGVRILVGPVGPATDQGLLERLDKRLALEAITGGDVTEQEEREFKALVEKLDEQSTIVLLDNFEDNQDKSGGVVQPRLDDVLARLVAMTSQVTLVFTTRKALTLSSTGSEIYNLDLGELSPAEALKFKVSRAELIKLEPSAWAGLVARVGGHPKALELFDDHLKANPSLAHRFLRRLDHAFAHVKGKLAAEHQERGRKLLIDAVIEGIPDDATRVLDRLSLLTTPLPTPELVQLLERDGVSDVENALGTLRLQGVLASSVSETALSGGDLVHRLIADARSNSLEEREGAERVQSFHRVAAEHFERRPGLTSDWMIAATHWTRAGDKTRALRAADSYAMALSARYSYRAAEQAARDALARVSLSDTADERVETASLLTTCHDALLELGNVGQAAEDLDAAVAMLSGATSERADFIRASVGIRLGRLEVQRGRIELALKHFERAQAAFERLSMPRDRAVTLGEIARLKAKTGDVARALALHEEMLGTFEQIGDVRSRAATLGDIARLKVAAGDLPAALALLEEVLGVFEQLGAVRERAVMLGDIARLKARAGDVSGALALHLERRRIYEQLGAARERAMTLGDIAQLKAQAGDVTGALALHQEELGVYEQLGAVRERAVTLGDIARLKAQAGNVSGALALHEERRHILEQLGDLRERAGALGDIARLKARAGDVPGALALHEEEIGFYEQLGAVRERAVALGDVARLKAETGDFPGARSMLTERLDTVRRLGDVYEIGAALFDLAQLDLADENVEPAVPRLG
jgi:tetratricopeptide (TPR) repeat protein